MEMSTERGFKKISLMIDREMSVTLILWLAIFFAVVMLKIFDWV